MSCCGKKGKPTTEHSLVKAGKSVIRHFTDPNYNAFSSDEEKKKRLKACGSCDKQETFMGKNRCQVCLCFVDAKASLVDQTCPHPNGNRWK